MTNNDIFIITISKSFAEYLSEYHSKLDGNNYECIHISDFSYSENNIKKVFIYLMSDNTISDFPEKLLYFIRQNNICVTFYAIDTITDWKGYPSIDINKFAKDYLIVLKKILKNNFKISKFEDLFLKNQGTKQAEIPTGYKNYYKIKNNPSGANYAELKKQYFTETEILRINDCQYLKEVNYFLTYPHFFYLKKERILKRALKNILKRL